MKIAACYIRVSTDKQTVENQRADVVRLAEARGYKVEIFEETESATKTRPVFDLMISRARKGEISAVVVWALDRFSRSMVGTVRDVLELDRLGVSVISVRDAWLDTGGPVRGLLLSIFGWVAEQELTRLKERTRAGLKRARDDGKKLGRPRASPIACGIADRAITQGHSIRRACAAAGVSTGSYLRWKARQRVEKVPVAPTPHATGKQGLT